MHSLVALELLALIHRKAASATTEAVAFGSEFATVADSAEKFAFVLTAVCRVEQFAAKTCNE
jgi:hypothetical protein